MIRLSILVAFITCVPCDSATTEQPVPQSGSAIHPFDPQDGQTVVFLGDSITHQSLYTQYIEDFFLTRFPDRQIHFHNAGVAGDKASDALVRFDEDVATVQPDFVTVLFGMNDGQYEEMNAATLHGYQESMKALLDRIKRIGARAIVLSPTMFDHVVTQMRQDDESWRFRDKEFSPDYNALMAFYGAWAMEEAARRKLSYVNLWAPLNQHTIARRRIDPAFTLIGDAIHPQASGQVLMAFEILSQLAVQPAHAGSIVITRNSKGGWRGSKSVRELRFDEQSDVLSFAHTASALPWVIPEKHATQPLRWKLPADGRLGYEITRAGHKLSADRLKIVGLPPGRYEVSIDNQPIGTWTHATLGTKIELQENELTPQFQQALKVAELNRRRNDEVIRPMRDKWGAIKGLRRRFADQPDRREKLIGEARATIAQLQKNDHLLTSHLHQIARPRPHRWVIRLVRP